MLPIITKWCHSFTLFFPPFQRRFKKTSSIWNIISWCYLSLHSGKCTGETISKVQLISPVSVLNNFTLGWVVSCRRNLNSFQEAGNWDTNQDLAVREIIWFLSFPNTSLSELLAADIILPNVYHLNRGYFRKTYLVQLKKSADNKKNYNPLSLSSPSQMTFQMYVLSCL